MHGKHQSVRFAIWIMLLLVIIFPSQIGAANYKDLTGYWEGQVEYGDQKFLIAITFETGKILSATIDIPQKGAICVPLAKINYKNKRIKFEIPGQNPVYFKGKLKADSITGSFKQGDIKGKFYISKTNQRWTKNTLSVKASKYIDEYYQTWEQKRIIIKENEFVNYYILSREKTTGKKANTLLIYLDGSGYQSVMGVKRDGLWVQRGPAFVFAQSYTEFDILVPEKVNILMGGDHRHDPTVLKCYSLNDRVNSVITVLDSFLKDHDYQEIFIYGVSEGGFILPKVYTGMNEKTKITKLIIWGAGGLSQYEEFKYLKSANLLMPKSYRLGYEKIDEAFREIEKDPDSVNKKYFGHTFKRWYGFLTYQPIHDLIKINIPILLIHGAKDFNSTVETSRIVDRRFKELGKTNLLYLEYPEMGHGPSTREQSIEIFEEIMKWLTTDSK